MAIRTPNNRFARVPAILCFALGVGACDKAADDQDKARSAESEANEKIAAATKEADEKVAAANASFQRRREEYRHTVTANLVDLDRDIAALANKAAGMSGQVRTDLDASIVQIRARRAAFVKDYELLEGASGATWDDTKVRLDAQWSQLKEMVGRE